MKLYHQRFLILIMFLTGAGCATIGGSAPDASVGKMPSKGPVGKTMTANSEKFATCARDSVTVQTGATQKIQLRIQINGQGQVLKPEILSMSSGDPDLRACLLRVLAKMKFPEPSDHKPRAILYPLELKPE